MLRLQRVYKKGGSCAFQNVERIKTGLKAVPCFICKATSLFIFIVLKLVWCQHNLISARSQLRWVCYCLLHSLSPALELNLFFFLTPRAGNILIIVCVYPEISKVKSQILTTSYRGYDAREHWWWTQLKCLHHKSICASSRKMYGTGRTTSTGFGNAPLWKAPLLFLGKDKCFFKIRHLVERNIAIIKAI